MEEDSISMFNISQKPLQPNAAQYLLCASKIKKANKTSFHNNLKIYYAIQINIF